jgi:glycosyltransferase involved in cell wall biosynthesis
VAPNVGSISESVQQGVTGYLVEAGDEVQQARRWTELLQDPIKAQQMGLEGRKSVMNSWSLDRMVHGYEQLIERTYASKRGSLRFTRTENTMRAEREAPTVDSINVIV